jgi:hypothetical protein
VSTSPDPFADLPPLSVQTPPMQTSAPAANQSTASGPDPFADLPPLSSGAPRAKGAPPVTAADRVHAVEGGILGGTAYLATLPADVPANIVNLARAGLGAGYQGILGSSDTPMRTPGGLYHYLTPQGVEEYSKDPPPAGATPVQLGHAVPSWLDVNSAPSPVGHWLTEEMDKNPITSTQPPRPDDPASRYLAMAGSVVPGAAAAGGGAIAPTVKALAGALPSATAGQAVSEAHPFESDTANRTASALVQALTSVGTPYATKALIRGVEPTVGGIASGAAPAEMGENIAAFRDANAEPSLAQAAGTRRMQFLESGISKIPGGAGVMQKAATQQAADLRGGVDQTIDQLAPGGVSPERAGRAITQGIAGSDGFKDQFNAKAGQLYDAVDQHIPPDSLVDVSNTLATLDRVAMPNPLAPKTTAALINPKVAAIRDALHADLGMAQAGPGGTGTGGTSSDGPWVSRASQPGPDDAAVPPGAARVVFDDPTLAAAAKNQYGYESGPAAGGPANTKLPYSTLADLRSRVGSMLTGSELVTDIPRAQVKQLYGGLSDDLRGAAQAAGPDAVQAFSRANNYYRAGMARMDTLANVLDKNGGPEQIFNGAMSGTKDGATRLRSVMQSLQPEQQQVVASTVFQRMGQATAGNQNAAGDVFSPETFLTNYNRMSPEAKSALFDRFPDLRDQADNLADVAQNLREGSRVFRNASGTAAAENQTHTLRDVLVGTLMGGGGAAAGAEGVHHFGPQGLALAGTALAVPATAYGTARALTNPAVVNWAANPALGSSAQAASLTAAPAALNAADKAKYQLINALNVTHSQN